MLNDKITQTSLISCMYRVMLPAILICASAMESLATVTGVDTINQMINISSPADGDTVIVKGYWQRGDGGGGLFYFDSNSAPWDGGTIFPVTGGCWERIFSGARNVRWFGAKGDGSQDDAYYIQLAINSLPTNGGTIYIPSGNYLLTNVQGSLYLPG